MLSKKEQHVLLKWCWKASLTGDREQKPDVKQRSKGQESVYRNEAKPWHRQFSDMICGLGGYGEER